MMSMEWLMPIFMILLVVVLIVQIVNIFASSFGKMSVKEIIPKFAADRIKKEDIHASKLNPHVCKYLYISESGNYAGGKIGKIIGIRPHNDFTKFIVKRGIFGRKIIVLCPRNRHTSLHGKDVIIYAHAIGDIGGFYFPEYDGSEFDIVNMLYNRIKKDIHHRMLVDLGQIKQRQLEAAIAGSKVEKEMREKWEAIEKFYEEEKQKNEVKNEAE